MDNSINRIMAIKKGERVVYHDTLRDGNYVTKCMGSAQARQHRDVLHDLFYQKRIALLQKKVGEHYQYIAEGLQ